MDWGADIEVFALASGRMFSFGENMKIAGRFTVFWIFCGCIVSLTHPVDCSAAEDDPMHVIRYFDARILFDESLKKTTAQDNIETLCDNYASRINQLRETLPGEKHYLNRIISHEITRLDSVKSEYLSNPRKFARIYLDRDWTDCRNYKEATADFRRVLGVKVRANPGIRPELEPDFGKGATILGKPFLHPVKDFVSGFKQVKGLKATSARVRVGMSGFPKNSFYYHPYDGDFTAYSPFGKCRFNRMYVVTDHWDQVVATQFTSESPKSADYIRDRGIGVFNYVQFRRLGKPSAWARYHSKSQEARFELHTLMGDSEGLKEINILILPPPTKRLISYALSMQ